MIQREAEREEAPSYHRLRVLLVDDDEEEYLLTRDLLADRSYLSSQSQAMGFELDWVATYEEALEAFDRDQHDVYLIDYYLGSRDGLGLLHEAMEKGFTKPIILMTGRGSYDLDIQAMKAGATDYISKNEVNAPLLERTIRYALERKRAEEVIRRNAEREHVLVTLSHAFVEASLSYPDILAAIPQGIAEVYGDGCILRLASKGGEWLNPVAVSMPGEGDTASMYDLVSLRQRAGEGLAGSVFQSAQPLLIAEVPSKGTDWVNEQGDGIGIPNELELGPWGKGSLACSILIVPLRAHGRSIGTLSALRFKKDYPYKEDDLVFFQDIAGRAALAIENAGLHAEVQKLAITDALTEAYNRRGLAELGHREIERARRFSRPLSVIMVDLDNFKDVNDSHGHAAGDIVLREVVDRLRSTVREVDILGRFGGDEFIVLLPETDLFMACAVAERLRQRVAEPILLDRSSEKLGLHISASLGVTSLTMETKDLDELIKRADAASYQAKRNGRNNVKMA